MKRAVRKALGQSKGFWPVRRASRPERVSSSKAAAASEPRMLSSAEKWNVGQLARRQRHAHRAQPVERRRVVLRVIGAAFELCFVIRLALRALCLGERGELIFRQRLQRRRIKRRLQITHAQLADVDGQVSVERSAVHAQVLTVGAGDRMQHECAVFDRARDWPDLVHRPGQRHRARAGHAAEAGPQSCCTATRRRRRDGAKRLCANGKPDAACGYRTGRSRGASARSLMRVPWIARASAEPEIALRQCAHRELREEYGSGGIQPLYDLGIFIDLLMFEAGRAPGRWITLYCKQVFRSPWNAVQRSAIVSARELAVSLRRLLQRALVRIRDDKLQQRIVAPQTRQVHLRQADGGDLLLPKSNAELAHGRECPRFIGDFAATLRLRDDLRDVRRGAQAQRLLRLNRRRRGARGDRIRHRDGRHAVRADAARARAAHCCADRQARRASSASARR